MSRGLGSALLLPRHRAVGAPGQGAVLAPRESQDAELCSWRCLTFQFAKSQVPGKHEPAHEPGSRVRMLAGTGAGQSREAALLETLGPNHPPV